MPEETSGSKASRLTNILAVVSPAVTILTLTRSGANFYWDKIRTAQIAFATAVAASG